MRRDLPPALADRSWAPPPGNFLGLEEEWTRWQDAAAVVLPVPYEATTSFGAGAREGPEAVLHASRYVELYDEELDAEPDELLLLEPPAPLDPAGEAVEE